MPLYISFSDRAKQQEDHAVQVKCCLRFISKEKYEINLQVFFNPMLTKTIAKEVQATLPLTF